jgi:hypothetical protein
MVKLWSLYLDFKKTSARVVYEVQIPRAQNIFMGSRVVYEVGLVPILVYRHGQGPSEPSTHVGGTFTLLF